MSQKQRLTRTDEVLIQKVLDSDKAATGEFVTPGTRKSVVFVAENNSPLMGIVAKLMNDLDWIESDLKSTLEMDELSPTETFIMTTTAQRFGELCVAITHLVDVFSGRTSDDKWPVPPVPTSDDIKKFIDDGDAQDKIGVDFGEYIRLIVKNTIGTQSPEVDPKTELLVQAAAASAANIAIGTVLLPIFEVVAGEKLQAFADFVEQT